MRKGCVIVLLLLVVVAEAKVTRGLVFEVGGAVGGSSLGYTTAETSDGLNHRLKQGFGAGGHLGAEWFFSRFVGVGAGLDITRYSSKHEVDGALHWSDVTDTDGELYNHTTQIDQLKETHRRVTVAPQVLLVGQIPLGPLKLHLGAGVEYDIPLASGYKAKGTVTHTGDYRTRMHAHDMSDHGFYTDDSYEQSGTTDKGQNFLAFVGRVDLLIPLAKQWDLGVGVLYKHALGSSEEAGGTNALGIRENKGSVSEEVWQAHYFMNDYAGIGTTQLTGGKYKPQLIAFNLSLRYTIPFQTHSHYKCMCADY